MNDGKREIVKNGNFSYKLQNLKLFNNSPDFIFVHDIQGNLMDVNKSLKKVLNKKNRESYQKLVLKDIINLNDGQRDKKAYFKFIKKLIKKPFSMEYALKIKENKKLSVRGYSLPLSDAADMGSKYFLHIAYDVSDKKTIQKELRATQKELKSISTMIPELRLWSLSQKKNSINLIQKSGQAIKYSEEKYKTILENIQEGYYEINLEGNLSFFNKAFCDIVGYPYEELIGLNYKKLTGEDTAKMNILTTENLLPKKNIQFKIKKKNNDKIYVESSLAEKYNSKGEKMGYFGIMHDISEQKKAEEQESKFREKLENEVSIRTHELHEALESQKLYMNEILKASNFKTIFLSTMSHELRTPLNAVIGFSDLLLEQTYGKLTNEQLDFINDINISAEHLLEMINKILDLSKIEAGKLELVFQKCNLKNLIEETLSIIRPIYAKKDLKLELKGINKNIEIIVDPTRLKEILFNLLSNAIKFTLKGEISLEFLDSEDEWVFNVRDTGIGIAEKDYNLIFKEFKRVQSEFVSLVPGSGLGLTLTKKLVNLHGGRIFFKSVLGKGSTFTFTIPKNSTIII